MDESRKLFLRGEVTINDLKTKLIMQDPTLPSKQETTAYKKEREIHTKNKVNERIQNENNMEVKRRIQETK